MLTLPPTQLPPGFRSFQDQEEEDRQGPTDRDQVDGPVLHEM